MQNHLKYITRSFMGVYRPHQAKALLLPDNGSVRGNKSYVQDLNFLGQPLNLLSKNRKGFCLTAVTKTPVMALSGDTLTRLPCYGKIHSRRDWTTNNIAGSLIKIFSGREPSQELSCLKDLMVRGFASSTGTRPVVSAHGDL